MMVSTMPGQVKHRLRLLHDAARGIGSLQAVEDIAVAAVDHALRAMEASGAVVLLGARGKEGGGGEEGGALEVRAAAGKAKRQALPPLDGAPIDKRCIVKLERALRAEDLCSDSTLVEAYRHFLFAPLEAGGSIFGLLGVSRETGELTPIELEFFCGLASVTAIALEHVRAHERALKEEKLRSRLACYFSPQVTEHLLHGRVLKACCAARREATVLFSDIRGFTALSQALAPDRVVALLNDYFRRMTSVIFRHGGMVDKLLGDGLMAVFGIPEPMADHPRAALAAAREMFRELEEMNRERALEGEAPLEIGVALHTGEVLAGDVGGGDFLDYTVIGHTVNLASRIEGLNKRLGTRLLVSEATRSRLPADLQCRTHQCSEIKGVAGTITVYEPLRIAER